MSNLEKLVPPLEDCEKIPKGSFPNSALVWVHTGEGYEVTSRVVWKLVEILFPAVPTPTLDEIAVATPGGIIVNFNEQCVESCKYDSNGESMHEYWTAEEWSESRNAATAALRLWFRVREEEKKND